jgi:hypothetical protein
MYVNNSNLLKSRNGLPKSKELLFRVQQYADYIDCENLNNNVQFWDWTVPGISKFRAWC